MLVCGAKFRGCEVTYIQSFFVMITFRGNHQKENAQVDNTFVCKKVAILLTEENQRRVLS